MGQKRNHLIRNSSIIALLTTTHSLRYGLPLLSVKVKPGGVPSLKSALGAVLYYQKQL